MRSPYPLQWPSGWRRTAGGDRKRATFQQGLAAARDGLVRQLEMLGAVNGMITSDLPVRADGLPYADGRASDPGIAVWFVLDGKERVFACDKWIGHAANMRAIALSIQAIRGLDRWGASDLVTRVFAGFNALPPGGDQESTKRPWRDVLDLPADGTPSMLFVKHRHRELIRKHHPDAGGDHAIAAELNAALAEAERELGA
jgi:hypothetical protein